LAARINELHEEGFNVPVHVAFSRASMGRSFWNKVIAWWTKYHYVDDFFHAELVFGRDLCFSADLADRKAGTRFMVREGIRDSRNQDWFVKEVNMSPEQVRQLFVWCSTQAGKPYDMLGIWGFVFGTKDQDPKKWYCSEVIARGLEYVGAHDLMPRKISPNRLAFSL
jgi:uncharacterized protein YycO